MTARPCLKAVGGKTVLLPEILPRLPAKIKTYYEPFVGGGAVFFALAAEKRFKHALIGDANAEFITAYVQIQRDVEGVVRALKKHVYEERYYYEVRAQDPLKLSHNDRAARLIYLNKTSFNGLYRVNRKGQFNVPFGKYTNPTICDEENLRAVAAVLKNEGITLGDFAGSVRGAKRGDAVYFDCPYWPVSESSNFTNYTKDGFGFEDQRRLRDCALRLKKKGVHVLLSNADVPPVRELYAKGFKIERVEAPRRINSKSDRRGDVGELLIT